MTFPWDRFRGFNNPFPTIDFIESNDVHCLPAIRTYPQVRPYDMLDEAGTLAVRRHPTEQELRIVTYHFLPYRSSKTEKSLSDGLISPVVDMQDFPPSSERTRPSDCPTRKQNSYRRTLLVVELQLGFRTISVPIMVGIFFLFFLVILVCTHMPSSRGKFVWKVFGYTITLPLVKEGSFFLRRNWRQILSVLGSVVTLSLTTRFSRFHFLAAFFRAFVQVLLHKAFKMRTLTPFPSDGHLMSSGCRTSGVEGGCTLVGEAEKDSSATSTKEAIGEVVDCDPVGETVGIGKVGASVGEIVGKSEEGSAGENVGGDVGSKVSCVGACVGSCSGRLP